MKLASVATIPGRERALAEMLESVEGQFDEVVVNDGSVIGDAAKFAPFFERDDFEYGFTLDDDLLYPPNYARLMAHYVDAYKREAVISAHGRNFLDYPIKSYYREQGRTQYRCLGDVPDDGLAKFADFPGTGVMCWHRSTLTFTESDFEAGKNMADVHVGVKLWRENVPAIVVPHESGWITHSLWVNLNDTIYEKSKFDDAAQTRIINEAFEEVFEYESEGVS